MKIAISEAFLEDFSSLSFHLQKKCRDIISTSLKTDAKALRTNSIPGWRIHKLNSSPFISFSVDMNFRILAKIENDAIYFHRVVNHALADSHRINQNDTSQTPLSIESTALKVSDIFSALSAIGIADASVNLFKNLQTEDQFLDALVNAHRVVAEYAMALYETSGVLVPRTKYTMLQSDNYFEQVLSEPHASWEIYLHASQEYVINLDKDYRVGISGSAGTGKTVCAWHRLVRLAKDGITVGFIAPNREILKVSQSRLEELTKNIQIQTLYFVPASSNDLIQLAEKVQHLIIDEGQEIPASWYADLAKLLRSSKVGLTVFYDLNQVGANYKLGDTNRFKYRVETFLPELKLIPQIHFLNFYINYRNSKEISSYYFEKLKESLPEPLRTELPLFSTGDVIVKAIKEDQLPPLIADAISKLKQQFLVGDIAIICLPGKIKFLSLALADLGINLSLDSISRNEVLITTAQSFRGHERKCVIACLPKIEHVEDKVGKAINAYIGYSRARDRLIVFEY